MPSLPIIRMAGTVIKSLLKGPACKMYPRRKPEFYPNTRGRVELDGSLCTLCGLCAKKCPAGALTVDRENRTWEIDRLKCVVCDTCAESCPSKAIILHNAYTPPTASGRKDLCRIAPAKEK